MITFYQRVPSAATHIDIDGFTYANSDCRMFLGLDGKYTVKDKQDARLLRVAFVRNGQAFVIIGKAGHKVANLNNLPFSVSALEDAVILLLDSARGRYIPKEFAESCDMEKWHVSAHDAECLKAGPDHPDDCYWLYWSSVLDKAHFYMDGFKWQLHQDGDLWAVCLELMTDDQKSAHGFFDE